MRHRLTARPPGAGWEHPFESHAPRECRKSSRFRRAQPIRNSVDPPKPTPSVSRVGIWGRFTPRPRGASRACRTGRAPPQTPR
eukprot:7486355-Pyramimonas_sp.AAC.1